MDLPVIDLTVYLALAGEINGDPSTLTGSVGPELSGLCREVSRVLRETGALLVKDPRCTAEDNDRFIDMMEQYFERPAEFKRLQERPALHYQVIVCYLFQYTRVSTRIHVWLLELGVDIIVG